MTVQITIIGLGQIGTSVGLALAEHTKLLKRVGHDVDPGVAQKARKLGALDEVRFNLPSAVENADIVLLSLPVNGIEETLRLIGPVLREDAVVMDTTPVKGAVAEWVKQHLPPRRYYVGLTPVVNPLYLHEFALGIDAAHPDLFHHSLIGISSPPGTVGEAIKLAADLARLVGSEPFFTDLAEADGLMASTHLLPQLTAAALLDATVDQPGWREARKVAGRAYAEATGPIVYQDESIALREAAMLNGENVVRVLDGMIASLQGLRNAIANGDKKDLTARIERAREGRLRWWKEREAGDWMNIEAVKSELPSISGFFKNVLTGLRPGKEDKEE